MYLLLELLCLCALFIGVASNRNKSCAAPGCICSGKDFGHANCTHFLSYVPNFPKSVYSVGFYGSNFSVIDNNLLTNISKSNILKLTFANTSTIWVTSDAFSNIGIRSLSILFNRFLKIENLSLQGLSRRFNTLTLENNEFSSIPASLLLPLKGMSIRRMSFAGNVLKDIDLGLFRDIKIKHLQLSNNKLSELTTYNNSIEYLLIDRNRFDTIPKFCEYENTSYLPKLRELHFDNNNFHGNLEPSNFQCLSKLEILILDRNRILYIQNNTFANLKLLSYLSIQQTGTQINLEPGAFNSPSMKKLLFGYNNFHFDNYDHTYLSQIFSNCKHLEYLDLTNNYLPNVQVKLKALFEPLHSLKHLGLQSARLLSIYGDMFRSFSALNVLILTGNSIHGWRNGTDMFGQMKSLTKLYMEANNINMVNKSSIPFDLLSNLTHISIGNNPFTCTCEQSWFTEWLRTTDINVVGYPKTYKCRSPPTLRNQLLKSYNPGLIECLPLYALISSIIGMVVVSILIVGGLVYVLRWDIRYLIFKMSTKYVPLEEEEHEYIAYVSYADEDRKFVHEQVCDKVPNICIRLRDFLVGEDMIDTVATHVEASKKVILVLSNNYFNSHWQAAELNYIHSVSVKRRKYICVVILLDDFDKKFLSPISRGFLHDSPCLEWTANRKGQKLFWRRLEHELAKPAKKYLNI